MYYVILVFIYSMEILAVLFSSQFSSGNTCILSKQPSWRRLRKTYADHDDNFHLSWRNDN